MKPLASDLMSYRSLLGVSRASLLWRRQCQPGYRLILLVVCTYALPYHHAGKQAAECYCNIDKTLVVYISLWWSMVSEEAHLRELCSLLLQFFRPDEIEVLQGAALLELR